MKRILPIIVSMFIIVPTGLAILLGVVHNYKIGKAIEAAETKREEFMSQAFTLSFDDEDIDVFYRDVCNFEYIIYVPSFKRLLRQGYTVVYTPTWNEENLTTVLQDAYRAGTDAELLFDEQAGWCLIPDEYSHTFDLQQLKAKLLAENPANVGGADMTTFASSPNVKSEDIMDLYLEKSKYNDFFIEYGCGARLSAMDFYRNADDPNSVSMEDIDLSEIKGQLAHAYDTTKSVLHFKPTNGEEISVPYKTYGISLNWDKEKDFILNQISIAESISGREPYLTGYDNFGNTYVEVSISRQHLWHYVTGKLCCETDIVTGGKGRHDTPTGVFFVSEMIPGKYLVGEGYRTWVDRWMRLTNTGIGLHDASWRSSFGSSIYTYNGSHGCINLPKNFAYNLYSELERGYPVVIY